MIFSSHIFTTLKLLKYFWPHPPCQQLSVFGLPPPLSAFTNSLPPSPSPLLADIICEQPPRSNTISCDHRLLGAYFFALKALTRITPSYRYLSRHLFAPLFGCIGYISGAHKKSKRLLWMSRTSRICWQDSISGDWFLCLGRAAEKWVALSNRPRVWRCLPLPRKANRFREIRGVGGPQPRHQIRTRHTLRDADFPFIQPLMDHGSTARQTKGSHHKILRERGGLTRSENSI